MNRDRMRRSVDRIHFNRIRRKFHENHIARVKKEARQQALREAAREAYKLLIEARKHPDTAHMVREGVLAILEKDAEGTLHAEEVWLRDIDGTGSMHVCSREDEGAVCFVPLEGAEGGE